MSRIEGHFEAKKHSYRQTQDGVVISFVVHPSDVSPELAAAPLGTVLMVGYAEVTGEETAPVEPPQKDRRPFHELPLPKQAGIVAADPRFFDWLQVVYGLPPAENETAKKVWSASYIRKKCDIESRSELATDPKAAKIFAKLVESYRRDTGLEAAPR